MRKDSWPASRITSTKWTSTFFVFLIRLPPRDVLDYFLLWIERSWESENLLRLKSNKNLKGSRRKREELVLFFSYFAVSPFLLEYSFSFNLQLVSIVQLTRIIVPPKTQNLACYDWGKKKRKVKDITVYNGLKRSDDVSLWLVAGIKKNNTRQLSLYHNRTDYGQPSFPAAVWLHKTHRRRWKQKETP